MRTSRILGLGLCAGLLACGYVRGQEEAVPEWKQQTKELGKQRRELQNSLRAVQKRLALGEDQEIQELKKAAEEAKRALEAKVREKISADPEGQAAYMQIDELDAQIKTLRPKREPKVKKEKREKKAKKEKKTAPEA